MLNFTGQTYIEDYLKQYCSILQKSQKAVGYDTKVYPTALLLII
jgi:hypothetical protein